MVDTSAVNKEIRLLWKETIDSDKWPNELPKLWPLQYGKPFTKPALVFVGMNPSLTIRDLNRSREKQIEDTSILLQEDGRNNLCDNTEFYPSKYFKHFYSFTNDTWINHWEHLDVFAVRNTNQKTIRKSLGLDKKLTDFADKQFEIFYELLKQIDPPVIVVPNASVSRILASKLNVGEMSFDDYCHFIRLNNHRVPIFFCGMLSGQGAMDTYSRKRLINMVRKMVDNLSLARI